MSQLMTRWLCICQEGPTVDGRLIKREWLTEAAELYDPSKYTAMIWPEHDRWYGSVGRVLELKAEPDGEGIMSLFARLCPDANLIYANKSGQLLFCSAEFSPDGDWRGSGKTYLEGLGVTNSPASVGTTRLQFNSESNKRRGEFKALVIEEFTEFEEEDKKLSDKANKPSWRKVFGLKEPSKGRQFADDTTTTTTEGVDPDKLSQLAEALASVEDQLTAVMDAVDKIKTAIDTKEFASLRDNLPNILTNFKKMEDLVTKEPDNNPAGTKEFNFL